LGISISSYLSNESVGSFISRVILFCFVPVEIPVVLEIPFEVPVVPADLPVAPEVGAAVVASPAGVLELDSHLSSESGPSEG
nr:hypothetical protein [Tanacetum cinerariifolium]